MNTGSWSKTEDSVCYTAVENQLRVKYSRPIELGLPVGFSWKAVASVVATRSGKQCRERWLNHLCPGINTGKWTEEEDTILVRMNERSPGRWSMIARTLKGRTPNQVKLRHRRIARRQKSEAKRALKRERSEGKLSVVKSGSLIKREKINDAKSAFWGGNKTKVEGQNNKEFFTEDIDSFFNEYTFSQAFTEEDFDVLNCLLSTTPKLIW